MKISTTIIFITLSIIFLSLSSCANKTLSQKKQFEQAALDLNTPTKIANWLEQNFTDDYEKKDKVFTYTREKGKFMPKKILALFANFPYETYFTKRGICVDAANFAGYCLNRAGYKVMVLTSFRKEYVRGISHTVCVYEENNKYYYLADTSYIGKIFGPYGSLEELAKNVVGIDNLAYYKIDLYRKGF